MHAQRVYHINYNSIIQVIRIINYEYYRSGHGHGCSNLYPVVRNRTEKTGN